MTKHHKLVALKRIRGEVIDKIYKEHWEEVWFFPEYKQVPGVKGFLGTDPILFVSINPSFGTFPSGPDHFLLSKSETARLWKRAPNGPF
jgi:hypothetical protein